MEYIENVYSRDNKYTFVVHAAASSEFSEFLQLYANGYLEKAAEKMKKLAKSDDDSRVLAACYNNLGNISDDLSEYKRAIAYYEEGISVENKNGYLWFNKAIAQYHESDVKASLGSFLTALKLNNGFDKALLNIGNIYFELQEFNKAYEYFKKVPRNSPLYRQSRYNIAIVMKAIDPGSKGRGLTDILRGLITQKDEISFLSALNLGNTYYTKGDIYQAREFYQTACNINTNNFIAFYNLALLEKQQKNYDYAIKYFEKAIRNRKSFNPAFANLVNSIISSLM